MPRKKTFTEYELATHKGRQIDESKSPDYCGSCSIELHASQLKDKASWVHSSIKRWEQLGGWVDPATPVLATEIKPADTITIESDGKAYTVYERSILLQLTGVLLGQQPYGMEPHVVVNRARDALKNAEAILPMYLEVAHKDR